MEAAGLTLARKRHLHRRALRLEYFTVTWNVIEAVVAITAGVIVGSVALIGFGADSGIEVISAVALLWRLRRADADADADTEAHAERRALYAVAATFFLLAAYIAFESISALIAGEEPDSSTVGLVLSLVSLAIMPALAHWKRRTGREMGSRALQADAVETWVCSYLSLALLIGVGAHAAFGWAWADPVGASLMLPVILWQGWETLEEAREDDDWNARNRPTFPGPAGESALLPSGTRSGVGSVRAAATCRRKPEMPQESSPTGWLRPIHRRANAPHA